MAKPNNKLIWHIATDESGVSGKKFYGFGSLWMKYQRRGDFYKLISDLKAKHGHKDEIKWQKANSKKYLAFFEELIEIFFKHQWLAFHCIIVRKGMVDKSYHNGNYQVAMQKHFTSLIANKVIGVLNAHPGRECHFRIEVDPLPFSYKKADEQFHRIANNIINKKIFRKDVIKNVIEKDSKISFNIQLADFFLGAIMSAFQDEECSAQKNLLSKKIASYLGWKSLRHDTSFCERKLNIWYFFDPTENKPREVKTQGVKLKYPLPPK